jgi:thiol-disulfide isomerase/thioredoxin
MNFFLRGARFFFLYSLLSTSSVLRGQSIDIGEQLPQLEWNNVMNYHYDRLKLADFPGKLIILDLWSTHCSSCILDFPKMDSLQKKFVGKVQFIMATYESKAEIQLFFATRKKIRLPEVPILTSDTLLHKLFPYPGVPLHIWIDSSGVVRSISDHPYTNYANITRFLDAGSIQIPRRVNATYTSSLFSEQWEPLLISYSYFSKWQDRLFIEGRSKLKEFKRISVTGGSPLQMYQRAFDGQYGYREYFARPGRSIVEAGDPGKYLIPADREKLRAWQEEYTYNYQLQVPESKEKEIYKIMKSDLDRQFELDARVEKRKVKCLVLVRTSAIDKLRSAGGPTRDNFQHYSIMLPSNDSIRSLYNQPYSLLSFRLLVLVEQLLHRPFVDDTGYQGNIDIQMEGKELDSVTLSGLRKQLKKYGLGLVEKEMLLEVLVLTEK